MSDWDRFVPVRRLLATSLLFLLAACGGGGGGSSPTQPPVTLPASIAGQVLDSPQAPGSLGPVVGVTVSVEGTAVSTVTDGGGAFSLGGVPTGSQTLLFQHSGQTARLEIDGILPSERIEMVVELNGDNVQVQSLERGDGTSTTQTTGTPSIDIEKSTNGEDADRAPGPSIPVGETVLWDYMVTNDGAVDLIEVVVTDDRDVVVTCPQATLAVRESMICTGEGVAVEGQYVNLGVVEAVTDTGDRVADEDLSHYFGIGAGGAPSIDIETFTNGEDADLPPGPSIAVGDPVAWDYVVTNDGEVDLVSIKVDDDRDVTVTCPQTELIVGESMTCTADGVAVEGQYANVGSASAEDELGTPASDEDPSHYLGVVPPLEPFTVEIQPDSWNTNWTGSNGTVSAKIEGGDLTTVDTTSILLFENDALVAATPVSQPGITGNHIRARFTKPDAFGILDTPQTGEQRTVTVQFLADGLLVELQATIRIVGPAL